MDSFLPYDIDRVQALTDKYFKGARGVRYIMCNENDLEIMYRTPLTPSMGGKHDEDPHRKGRRWENPMLT